MFHDEPISREQSDEPRGYPLLDEGVYKFVVAKANFRNSAKGNKMIELQLCVYDNNDKAYIVFDYLIAQENMRWKTRHFCDAVGLDKQYEAKEFNEYMCPGREGYVELKIQPAKDGYAAKNAVLDYCMTDKGLVKSDLAPPNNTTPKATNGFVDDDILF